jgi:hypothetical protein
VVWPTFEMSDGHDLGLVVGDLAMDDGVGIVPDQDATGTTDQGPSAR